MQEKLREYLGDEITLPFDAGNTGDCEEAMRKLNLNFFNRLVEISKAKSPLIICVDLNNDTIEEMLLTIQTSSSA